MESHLEARLWNDVFNYAQDRLKIIRGSIRATVLIETILAAFEMNEILYELKDHSAGLNCGRWDYIFSFIKKFKHKSDFILPDRSQVTMNIHFMNSYVQLLIKTCHRRGIHAMGGMAAQIPIRGNASANEIAMQKVRNDKINEAKNGHDGTWVAHPGLIPIAKDAFSMFKKTPNQIANVKREEVNVTSRDLLTVPSGTITLAGLKSNIIVCILYLEGWLRGIGCAPINNLMEDLATAEICRFSTWQWVRHGAKLEDGQVVTRELVTEILNEELVKLKQTADDKSKFDIASRIVLDLMITTNPPDFMPDVAYNEIVVGRDIMSNL